MPAGPRNFFGAHGFKGIMPRTSRFNGSAFGVSPDTRPMEAKRVTELPRGRGWQYEPKWDGFRCLAFRDGGEVELRAKSGKSLTRYFPEIADALATLKAKTFVLDGELVVPVNGAFAFDALQMRLHPAESRVLMLAAETPASYILFDILRDPKRTWMSEPLRDRRRALKDFFRRFGLKRPRFELSPATTKIEGARKWLKTERGQIDGIVAKRLDEPYRPEERAMQKFKKLRTADCVVGGFRYGEGSNEVGSLLLGLYDHEGKLDHVGFTSSIHAADRRALTKRLEALIEPPGFTGRAPGGPSRWSTERSAAWKPLKPKLVAEVCFDHVSNERFRHGTKFMRWRPDKSPRQCTFDQIL
jgi:ATP-dependent DNA ligase